MSPDEKAINFPFEVLDSFKIDNVSSVLPEMLVQTTYVLSLTVLGK